MSMFNQIEPQDNVVSILSAKRLQSSATLLPTLASHPNHVDNLPSFSLSDYCVGEAGMSFDDLIAGLQDQGICAERIFITQDDEMLIVAND